MDNAIYFMPDISGFTEFVNTTELEHSVHIISELLELLIDNVVIDLELIEIEGDALFMFTSKIPSYKDLLNQMEIMLTAFYKHTQNYESKRICHCGSCSTTTNLELKFLVHYGNLTFIKVKEIIKPYGRDVIKIHRLLKNEVPINEYALFTNATHKLYKNDMDNTWAKLKGNYDQIDIDYFYKNIEDLKEDVVVESNTDISSEKINPTVLLEKIIDSNIQNIHTYISELKYRHLWDKDVKRIAFDENKVNRAGTEHNCVLNMGNLNFETLSPTKPNEYFYGESTKDMMFTNNFSYFINFYKIDNNTTEIKVSLFLELTTIGTFMKSTIIKAVTKSWLKKLDKLQLILIKKA